MSLILLTDPFMGTTSLMQMLNTIDRIFDDHLLRTPSTSVALPVDFRTPWDVKEDDDAFRLRLDMPGLSKEEVSVQDFFTFLLLFFFLKKLKFWRKCTRFTHPFVRSLNLY